MPGGVSPGTSEGPDALYAQPQTSGAERMTTLDQSPEPVNFAAAEAAYKQAGAAVDAFLADLKFRFPHHCMDRHPRLLALIAAEEAAYEAMFHAASERQRRARMMVSGAFETDARREFHLSHLVLALVCSMFACGSDDACEPDDEPSGCVCDAFGPPGIFDPSTCDDGRECCDANEDGIEDAAPTRIVCVGGGK